MRLYATQDANFNVTGLVSTAGTVEERFLYDPYGNGTVLSSSWGGMSDTYEWPIRHQGLMWDVETGLIYNRARMLHSLLGFFGSRDPLGYVDGSNLYQYVSNNPTTITDPGGTTGIQYGPCNEDFLTCMGNCISQNDPLLTYPHFPATVSDR